MSHSPFVQVVSFLYMHAQIAAGETKNPRRNLPKAIRRVYIRLVVFYVAGSDFFFISKAKTYFDLGTFIIGLLVPSTEPRLNLGGVSAASPFVIAIQDAGIGVLPSVSSIFFPFRRG